MGGPQIVQGYFIRLGVKVMCRTPGLEAGS